MGNLHEASYVSTLYKVDGYNRYRRAVGKPYDSLSRRIKQRVKTAVSYISDFEQTLVEFAQSKKCHGVICGHIHHPENRYYGDIHYLNSGDWVETMSALAEDEKGNWHVLYYAASEQELLEIEKAV